MTTGEELPQRRTRAGRGRSRRGRGRQGRGRGARSQGRGRGRAPPRFSTNVVVVLKMQDAGQDERVKAAASQFGEVVRVNSRTANNGAPVYIVEFADENAAAQAVQQQLPLDEGAVVEFKRLPPARTAAGRRADRPRGEGDPCLVYVAGISNLSDEAVQGVFGGSVQEITRANNNRFAFVRFANEADAQAALSKNGQQLEDGTSLRIEPHRPLLPPPPLKGTEDPVKIAVRFPADVSDEQLAQVFASAGNIADFERRNRNVAFITFETAEAANAALEKDGYVFAEGQRGITVRKFINAERASPEAAPQNTERAPAKPRARRALDSNTVYVGNIQGLDDDAVKGFFDGTITEFARRADNFALVSFSTDAEAENALGQNDVTLSDEKNLIVSKEMPRRQTGRRRVFVAGFPEDSSPEIFNDVFTGIKRCNMRKRSAVLIFDTPQNAEAAVQRNGETVFEGQPLRVEYSRR
eukprot:m.183361 g.183361  ORF g.183361 m.183361 type:complete len:468 (-) comp16651_c0_seq1:166-1569(-)